MTRHPVRSALGWGALTAASHIAYPAALAVLTRGRRAASPTPVGVDAPPLTVIVAAYKEAGVIAAKVQSIREDGYPGEVRILVVADGDPETAAAATAAGAEALAPAERLGKSQALNLAVAQSTTDIVVLTDANNPLRPGSLAAMVRHFTDPDVGAVAGKKADMADEAEGLYWRYEDWLKRKESLLGSTIGMVGELNAVRRSLWEDIPADVANDDLWIALNLIDNDYRVVYEPEAVAYEQDALPAAEQWQRRVRIAAGQFVVLDHKRHMLDPRRGTVALQLWGHRAWRTTIGPLAHVALVTSLARSARRSPVAALGLAANAAVAASVVRPPASDAAWAKLVRAARQLFLLHGVALAGLRRYAGGDRATKWQKPSR